MRNVIKRERIRVEGAPRAACRPDAEENVRQERGVRLVNLDDGAVAVEYTCKCGEVVVFQIEFEPPAQEA